MEFSELSIPLYLNPKLVSKSIIRVWGFHPPCLHVMVRGEERHLKTAPTPAGLASAQRVGRVALARGGAACGHGCRWAGGRAAPHLGEKFRGAINGSTERIY